MSERNRDDSIGHILRRVLPEKGLASEPGTSCIDGETIAAWAAGTLRNYEAAAVERHLADCERCQSLMAVFVQSAPTADPAHESVWSRWRLGWIVPLATAATVAALWIGIPGNRPADDVSDQLRKAVINANSPAPPASAPEAAAAQSPPLFQTVQEKPGTPVTNEEARARANLAEASRELLDERAAGAALTEPVEADKRESSPLAAPRPFAARLASTSVEIASTDGSIRWRIVNGRQVEWSTSTTTEWTAATLASPDVLTAGAAPSASVCWIVGRRGAVYLTTDRTGFTRLPFPETTDLTSVTATDDRTATVSSLDGRSWRTSDQGTTWSVVR